ncbi:hypothetical protein A9Q84_02200 [Halobacteriovorax marinus]|uniref:Uncharacterized protein n=1 Tax=Halobacteriovorax marinus TaxID=97084 RepID=A0A1Y5FCD0_9BACT|nr:hypothetical protein A9Q84_02200 [Halobacteriovorax marinus]
MSYEFYKFLHIAFIIIVAAGLGVAYHSTQPKYFKILTGISSLLILVTGMGLLARIGVSHGDGFPGWVIVKMCLWLVLAVAGPVLAKRLPDSIKPKAFWGIATVLFVAVYMAVNKPF